MVAVHRAGAASLCPRAVPLREERQLDPCWGGVRLGEASPSAHEFCAWTGDDLTPTGRQEWVRLVAVESDWAGLLPGELLGHRVSGAAEDPMGVLAGFDRWPTKRQGVESARAATSRVDHR